MKALRLGREKSGSNEGRKKRVDKQLKQKHKEEKTANNQGAEVASAAPYFVDALCEKLDLSIHDLPSKLLGCGQIAYVGVNNSDLEWLDETSDLRWGVVGTVPPRHSYKLGVEEHQALMDAYSTKPGVAAIITGVEYGKPPHGETKPCAPTEDQRAAFEIHVKTALKLNLPIILIVRPEAREAEESDRAVADALAWLTEFGVPDDYKILFSSWVGTPKMALTALKRFKNAHISLNAAATFRSSSHLREIAFDTPLARLLLESSTPAVPPMNQILPHSSWTVLTVAQTVAESKRMEVKDLLKATNENAAKFFNKELRKLESKEEDQLKEVAEKASISASVPSKSSAPTLNDDEALAESNEQVHSEDEEDIAELQKFLE